MDKTDLLVLVNNKDEAIGAEEKIKVHKEGLLHRAFSVFIFRHNNNNTELLLQKRHLDKYHSGGLWSNTCCGHPKVGEQILQAAQRRLAEEFNIESNLIYINNFVYFAHCNNNFVEHELDHVFIGNIEESNIQAHPLEIEEYRWITLENLNLELKNNPEIFTPWFTKALTVAIQAKPKIKNLLLRSKGKLNV